MYTEDELLQLSGLQHLLFCERQFALIHLEQIWTENRFTAEGRVMHEHVDEPGYTSRKDIRVAYGVMLRSLRLGLSGKADVIEFHRRELRLPAIKDEGVLAGIDPAEWEPYPVEYKRGRPKNEPWDAVQMCAQALCLEEMLNVDVPAGAIFYGQPRRREIIEFDMTLRRHTEETAARMHRIFSIGVTPPPVYESAKCRACSLYELCQPKMYRGYKSVESYLERVFLETMSDDR